MPQTHAGIPPFRFIVINGLEIPSSNCYDGDMSYAQHITEAADLLDPDEWEANPEYLRGMCELLARIHGLRNVTTDDRALMVQRDIGMVLGVKVDHLL